MRKISSRQISNKKYAQVGGPDTVLQILNRIANGSRVSPGMLSALRGFITTNPASVVSALGRVSNLSGLIANSSVVPELAPLLPSVGATSGAGGALASGSGSALAAGAGSAGTAATGATGAAGSSALAGGTAGLTGTGTAGLAGGVSGAGTAGSVAGTSAAGGGALVSGGGGGALVSGGGGAGAASSGAGTGAAVAGGIGAGTVAIGASLLALLAYPKINQMLYGGISKDDLKVGNPSDVIRQKLVDTVSEYWSKIIDCDVAEGSYGGDLTDIATFENTKIIKNYADMLYVATTNPKMRDYPLKQITFNSIVKNLAEAEDASGGTWSARFTVGARDKRSVQTISSSPCVKESVGIFLTWMNDYIKTIKERDSTAATTNAPSSGSTPTPPISGRGGGKGRSAPQGTSDSGYKTASLIMKEGCYLKSIQSSWTPEFDAAFREFVDAGTAAGKVPTTLAGNQEWSDVAGSLGVSPDKSGAFSIINSLAKVVPSKCSTSSATTGPTAPPVAPAETKPVAKETEDYPILAAIIGAMYNEKLVGTPGFDLIKEPKRIQAIVDSVGGANEAGYGNTARIIAKRNPAILARLPKQLTAPVDEVYAKNPANKRLLQDIQVAINGIFDSSVEGSKILGIVNPALPKATELVSEWLRSPAGGNWKDKVTTEEIKPSASSIDQWIKLASERKMRIRAKIAAEMTPPERAAARRTKMREAV